MPKTPRWASGSRGGQCRSCGVKRLIACEPDLQNHLVFAQKYRRNAFGGRRRRESGETLRTLRQWKKAEHHRSARTPGAERRISEQRILMGRAWRGCGGRRGEASKKPVYERQARGSRIWQTVPTRRMRRRSRALPVCTKPPALPGEGLFARAGTKRGLPFRGGGGAAPVVCARWKA